MAKFKKANSGDSIYLNQWWGFRSTSLKQLCKPGVF